MIDIAPHARIPELTKMTQVPSADPAEATAASGADRPALWTRGFTLLLAVTVLCYSSYQLVSVVLPLFVQSLGGSPVIAGLVFSSFSFTSFIFRPLIGHLLDTWSVRRVLVSGTTILGALSAVLVFPSLWLAFVANAVRGVGWGAFSTAQSTGVALAAPVSRRAEAAGYSSVATTSASAFAPALALWLLNLTGKFPVVFLLAGAAGLAATAGAVMMPPTGSRGTTLRRALTLPGKGLSLETFIERPVLLASLLLVCVTMTQPVTFAFVPLHAQAVGVHNISLYYVTTGATGILARIVLGRFVDRVKRGVWIAAGYSAMLSAFAVLIIADRIEVFVIAGFLVAIGHSLAQPSLNAFAMDLAAPGRMGKAMATFSMAYRVGEGLGAPLAGTLIVVFGYPGMYAGAMAFALAGLVLTALNWRSVGRPLPRHAPA